LARFLTYPIRDALRRELSWTHYRLLLRVDDPEARAFYEAEAINPRWSTRELERPLSVTPRLGELVAEVPGQREIVGHNALYDLQGKNLLAAFAATSGSNDTSELWIRPRVRSAGILTEPIPAARTSNEASKSLMIPTYANPWE
jgi:hypothetical protein